MNRNRIIKGAVRLMGTVLLTTAFIMTVSVLTEGMYLLGIPAAENVERVEIRYPALTEERKEISDKEEIELAVALTGFLKYSLFEKGDEDKAPLITITYYLEDGRSVSVAADRDTLWWKGKAHGIKNKGNFVKLAEGIFFLEEAVAREGQTP